MDMTTIPDEVPGCKAPIEPHATVSWSEACLTLEAFIDNRLPVANESEIRAFLAVWRRTHGWQKDTDTVGTRRLAAAAGISRPALAAGLVSLQEHGLVLIVPRHKARATYTVPVAARKPPKLANSIDQSGEAAAAEAGELAKPVDQIWQTGLATEESKESKTQNRAPAAPVPADLPFGEAEQPEPQSPAPQPKTERELKPVPAGYGEGDVRSLADAMTGILRVHSKNPDVTNKRAHRGDAIALLESSNGYPVAEILSMLRREAARGAFDQARGYGLMGFKAERRLRRPWSAPPAGSGGERQAAGAVFGSAGNSERLAALAAEAEQADKERELLREHPENCPHCHGSGVMDYQGRRRSCKCPKADELRERGLAA